MRIAIASDHAGFQLKQRLVVHLQSLGHAVADFGADSDKPVDYPDYIFPAAQSVVDGEADAAIVLGGSGNGEAIVANKLPGIRCAVCWNAETARLAKEHNNANVISIGQRMVTEEEGIHIVDAWMNAQFEGGRHLRRIEKIESSKNT